MGPIIDSEGWITSVNGKAPEAMSYSLSEQSSVDDAASTTTANTYYSSASSATSSSTAASTSSSSRSDTSRSPRLVATTVRTRAPPPLSLGVDSKSLVGKVLKHLRRSDNHPTITLAFADDSAVQVLVDGYNPRSARVVVASGGADEEDVFGSGPPGNHAKHFGTEDPNNIEGIKEELEERVQLEMDDTLSRLLSTPGSIASVGAAIRDCALIRMTDRAHTRAGARFDAHHQAFAVKFEGGSGRWHCIWATRAVYDAVGHCVARTFDDVYVQPLVRTHSLASAGLPRSPMKVDSPTKSPMKSRGGRRHQRRESWRN